MLATLLPAAIEYAKGLRPFLGLGNPVPQKLRRAGDIGESLQCGRQRGVPFTTVSIPPLGFRQRRGLEIGFGGAEASSASNLSSSVDESPDSLSAARGGDGERQQAVVLCQESCTDG